MKEEFTRKMWMFCSLKWWDTPYGEAKDESNN